MKIDQLQTPCYVIDEKKMRENLEILKKVQEDTGCKILLAQKAFSGFALYPMIGKYLAGTTASGLFEARLGHEEMGSYTNGLTSESVFTFDDYYLAKPYLRMLKEGKVPMSTVDDKASRILRLIFRTAINKAGA